MLESLTCGPMPGGRDSEVIPGSLVLPDLFLRCLHGWALMSWGQVQLTCPLTHSLVTRGGHLWCSLTLGYPPRSRLAIFSVGQTAGSKLQVSSSAAAPPPHSALQVPASYAKLHPPGHSTTDATDNSSTRISAGLLHPLALSTGGNSCLSWATVAVKHKLSLCSWGTLGVFPVERICPPIHTPDSYPDSYPSAAICSQEPLALWAVLAKLCRPNPQKTQNSKRSAAKTSSRIFRRSSPEGGFGRLMVMY